MNWTEENSRVVQDYLNESQQETPLEVVTPENWADYDVIFIGYPIWWQEAAWPINDFVEENDFSGTTVIPFATSTSSDLGESGNLLAEMAGTGNWEEGQRFSSSATSLDVAEWLTEIGYEDFYGKREQLFILKRNKFWYNTLY